MSFSMQAFTYIWYAFLSFTFLSTQINSSSAGVHFLLLKAGSVLDFDRSFVLFLQVFSQLWFHNYGDGFFLDHFVWNIFVQLPAHELVDLGQCESRQDPLFLEHCLRNVRTHILKDRCQMIEVYVISIHQHTEAAHKGKYIDLQLSFH